jgi:16S rRNA (adenine1518-N6/adenine1519-N6)-dimethyltransferase
MKHKNVSPKKHLGQHFLNDEATAHRIAHSVQCDADQAFIEVGPGTGALTTHLIDRFGPKLLALDVDAESIEHLQSEDWISSEQIRNADILKVPLDQLTSLNEVVIVGNFPYNISSQILFRALDWRENCVELVGMFQKEVAERVCAPHGSKVYGILSVLLQTYYDAEYLFTVPPHVFVPPPKVQSGVIRLVKKAVQPQGVSYKHLKRVTKAAFNQRRKTLRNALRSGGLDISQVDVAFLTQRAEQLSPEEFAKLAASIPSGPA